LLIVLYAKAWWMLPVSSMLFLMFPASFFYPAWVWSIPAASFLVPLAGACVLSLPIVEARRTFDWARAGQLDQLTWILVVLTSLISALALILWALWTDYLGVATQMLGPLRSAPRWFSLLILIPGFAIVNAFAEEAAFRGVLQGALERFFPLRERFVILVQASVFAAFHYHGGFPNGKVGYLMTFVYACMLGVLRRRSGGLLAPYLTHVVADSVIGLTLVLLDN
jgi:membrane protease YdiL (CAAX protease family)